MEFNEAFTIMQGVNRAARASVRLEEVLKVAADAERVVGEASVRKAMLDKEVAASAAAAGKLRVEVEELEGGVEELKGRAVQFKEEKVQEAKVFLAELEGQRALVVAQMQAGVEEAEVQAHEARRLIAAETEKLMVSCREAREALRVAEREFAAFQSRIGKT